MSLPVPNMISIHQGQGLLGGKMPLPVLEEGRGSHNNYSHVLRKPAEPLAGSYQDLCSSQQSSSNLS